MDGSNGKMIELLERIAVGQEAMREEMAGMRAETSQLREDMNKGFAQVNARIDNALALGGRYHADHEQRIQALEASVFSKSG